jgi:hypothetical protein
MGTFLFGGWHWVVTVIQLILIIGGALDASNWLP